MKKQRRYEKLILLLELLGFGGVLLLIWLDEYVDLPFLYFGALKTPPRPPEYWFETFGVLSSLDGDRSGDPLGFSPAAYFGRIRPGLRLVAEGECAGGVGFF